MPSADNFVPLLITFNRRIRNHLLELETMTSGNFLETKSNCGLEYTSFVVLMILAMGFAAILPQIIACAVLEIKSIGSDKRSAYQILEEILAKANLEERNEAFLDACVEYSKEQVGKKEEEFDREHGLGKSDEVYSHFIRMESKRLEEKRKAEEESGAKVPEEKAVPEEKIADMV
jgi:hypothetical protein